MKNKHVLFFNYGGNHKRRKKQPCVLGLEHNIHLQLGPHASNAALREEIQVQPEMSRAKKL
jgi:hypothetical protein